MVKVRELIIDELAEGRSREKRKSEGSQNFDTVIIDRN